MLYDPARRFIFVHIWKTGGTSIVTALRDVCPIYFRNRLVNKAIRSAPGLARSVLGWRAGIVAGQHMTAQEIRREMPSEVFDPAFKFAFVRNPWDWQVSNYFYALESKTHAQHAIISSLGTFDAYIRHQHQQMAPAQSSFIYDDDGQSLIDFVGRFERLEEDFQTVCQKIGVRATLPHLNASKRERDWRSYYTPETRALVANLFRCDLDRFGYTWN